MAGGLRSSDQPPPRGLSSASPAASSSVSKPVKSSQGGRGSNSERTPLLSRIGSQERQNDGYKSKLLECEIPFWQNQPLWSTGLFDCVADVPMCCFTIFLPCFAFGQTAESLDGTKNSCWTHSAVWFALQHSILLGCLYSARYRGRLRAKFNIPEGPVPDGVVHCLCWPCAFCQEHRELRYRSFGPEFWGPTVVMVAPVEQRFATRAAKGRPVLQ